MFEPTSIFAFLQITHKVEVLKDLSRTLANLVRQLRGPATKEKTEDQYKSAHWLHRAKTQEENR